MIMKPTRAFILESYSEVYEVFAELCRVDGI